MPVPVANVLTLGVVGPRSETYLDSQFPDIFAAHDVDIEGILTSRRPWRE
jgi:hypothetical protein